MLVISVVLHKTTTTTTKAHCVSLYTLHIHTYTLDEKSEQKWQHKSFFCLKTVYLIELLPLHGPPILENYDV